MRLPASEGAEREPILELDAVLGIVEIRSAADGSLVEGVHVEVLGSDARVPVEDGRFELPVEDSVDQRGLAVLLEAPGFCRRMLWVPFARGVVIAELCPSASLGIRLVNEVENPVEGAGIALLPPRVTEGPWGADWRFFASSQFPSMIGRVRKQAELAGRPLSHAEYRGVVRTVLPAEDCLARFSWGSFEGPGVLRDCLEAGSWVRSTDTEGLAVWEGLPALPGYVWGCPETVVAQFDPPAPVHDLRRSDGVLVVGDGQPAEDLSGSFALRAGGGLRLEGVVPEQSRVLGRLPEALAAVGQAPIVKLIGHPTEAEEAAAGMANLTNDGIEWARSDGSFEFTGVLPGLKHLSAWWRDASGDVYFVDQPFELALGETLDLGDVFVRQEVPWEVNLELVDADKQKLPAASALGLDEPPNVALLVILDGWGPGSASLITETFVLPVGEQVRLLGLPPGRGAFTTYWEGLKDPKGTPELDAGRFVMPTPVMTSEGPPVPIDLSIEFIPGTH